MQHQQLNGITDWWESGTDLFSEAVEYASGVASDTWSMQSSMITGAYDWVSEKAGEISDDAMLTLKDFQKKMSALFKTQREVDEAIASLPENSPLRAKLEAKRQESRGVFEEFILPAWNSFSEWAGFEEASNFGGGDQGMGVLISGTTVLVVLGAVSVAIVWVNKAHALELAILDDPDLKQQFVAQHGSTIAAVGQIGKYVMWGIGGIALIYVLKVVREFAD